jgi:hypothetical protein
MASENSLVDLKSRRQRRSDETAALNCKLITVPAHGATLQTFAALTH